jgi:hypothetical protein
MFWRLALFHRVDGKISGSEVRLGSIAKPSSRVLISRSRQSSNQVALGLNALPCAGWSHRPSDRSGRYSFTRSEVDPFQVRAKVRTPLAAPVEENSGLAVGA